MTLTAPPKLSALEGWTLHEYSVASSTNLVASDLPVWQAVRADTQTAGRGRFQRTWVSDEGGLWLSAVVPAMPPAAGAAGPERGCPSRSGSAHEGTPQTFPSHDTFLAAAAETAALRPSGEPLVALPKCAPTVLPLVAGLAVCDALREAGVQGLRLRWPNDVLVNDLKLAGVLLDQFSPGVAVVGMGVNVSNQPEVRDAGLKNRTTRLADLLPTPPSLGGLTAILLARLRSAVTELNAKGFAVLLPRINELWGRPRRVELDLDGEVRRGLFTGVDEEGRLILSEQNEGRSAYAAHQVRHLAEV